MVSMNHLINNYNYFSCPTGGYPWRLAFKRDESGRVEVYWDQGYHPLGADDAKALAEWLLDAGPLKPGETVRHNIFGRVTIVALDDRGFAWVTGEHPLSPKEGVLVDVKNLSRS